jgi:hypothetical protein
MSKLILTPEQAVILSQVNSFLDEAFSLGTQDSDAVSLINPIPNYNLLRSEDKEQIKTVWEAVIASFIKVMNIPNAFPSTKFSGTVTLAKITNSGSNGSITFVDGISTVYIAPT